MLGVAAYSRALTDLGLTRPDPRASPPLVERRKVKGRWVKELVAPPSQVPIPAWQRGAGPRYGVWDVRSGGLPGLGKR